MELAFVWRSTCALHQVHPFHMIVLITPVVEVDGRDRMVTSTSRTKPSRQGLASPSYWGHYVAHDNNRDAMAMTLKPYAERSGYVSRPGTPRCCTTCTNPFLFFTTTLSGTAPTMRGSIPLSPTNGRKRLE